MKRNIHTEYELFTRHIYEKIVNSTAIKPIYVRHDIKLQGQSEQEYQIDVYFEYENHSGKQRVVIECKDYKSSVPISRVRDFFGVLHDLGDNVKGVMVSKKGFQRGAKTFAKQYGVSLIELREVSEEEIIGEINTKTHLEKTHHLYLVDEGCALKRGINTDIIRKRYSEFQPQKADYWLNSIYIPLETVDSDIYDSNGQIITSLDELDYNTPFKPLQAYSINFKDAWVKTRQWGTVKIKAVRIKSEINEQDITINLQANGFVEALIQDVLLNKSQFVPKL